VQVCRGTEMQQRGRGLGRGAGVAHGHLSGGPLPSLFGLAGARSCAWASSSVVPFALLGAFGLARAHAAGSKGSSACCICGALRKAGQLCRTPHTAALVRALPGRRRLFTPA